MKQKHRPSPGTFRQQPDGHHESLHKDLSGGIPLITAQDVCGEICHIITDDLRIYI